MRISQYKLNYFFYLSKMKILFLILAFGFISCRTDPTEVYDMYYNYEYSLTQKYDLYNYYVFRLPVNEGDKMDMEFKIPLDASHNFHFEVYWYNSRPDDNTALNHIGGTLVNLLPKQPDPYLEDGYQVYPYTFQSPLGSTFFSIKVTLPMFTYSYIIFRINLLKYKYSNIKDLEFNQEYTLDTSIFGDKKIPKDYEIYIRVPAFGEDVMEVQLTTHEAYDKSAAFAVEVCQYKYKPTQQQVYYPDTACSKPLENTSTENKQYVYPFTTEKEITFLSIRIKNKLSDLRYLYMYIYSEKGLTAAIIAVIVIACVVFVGGIGYFIGRKLGCCNK